MNVKDMNLKDFHDLCEARAEWGHKKYGDADKNRDTAKDCIEECADIINICGRRKMWFEKAQLKEEIEMFEVKVSMNRIKNLTRLLFFEIVELDEAIKKSGYNEPEKVKRVWFD